MPLRSRLHRQGAIPVALLALSLMSGCNKDDAAKPVTDVKKSFLFSDVTDKSGIDYKWTIPGSRPLNILQTIGNGCAFLDYDNDGNQDILLVGTQLALYKGDGKGGFTDVTKKLGLDKLTGHFLGCAVGDVDGDGYDDLFISGYRTGILLKNERGERFSDVTKQSGIKPQPWGTSCAFAETVPGSGKLDLYVGNYAVFGPNEVQLCKEGSLMTSCGPRYYKEIPGVFYRNDGKGHFTDITKATEVMPSRGRTLGVAFADFNGSGKPGLALANDENPGDLFEPLQGTAPKYKNIGQSSSVAYDRDGNVHGGMGTDWGDFDNDGKLDLFVATFYGEVKCLYKNNGDSSFSEVGIPTGLGALTSPYVAFGCKFIDYDNDGWLDIAIANGHVQDNIQDINHAATYLESFQLFRNRTTSPTGFEEVSGSCDPKAIRPIVGRGMASGDYDNDGRDDLLIVDSEGKPLLLHNDVSNGSHWLGVKLDGRKSNRDGYGAILTLKSGGRTLVRHCHSDGSYLSASDKRVRFGLGASAKVDELTVKWPSGEKTVYANPPADKYISIVEGDKQVH